MDWDDIIGHENNIKVLKALLSSFKIPHALLFTGPDGVGKMLTAKIFAAGILCEAKKETQAIASNHSNHLIPCGICLSCRHYNLSQHPDFKIVRQEETSSSIKIEQIRELKRFALLSPALREGRVCIVENAQNMTREAANSFLKLLEEPPPNFYFILVASWGQPLIETIVSRCRRIDFPPLPPQVLAVNLAQKNLVSPELPPEKILAAANLSGGRVGKALELLSPDGFTLRNQAVEYVKVFTSERAETIGEFLNSLENSTPQEMLTLLEYVGSVVRDMLFLVISNKNTALKNDGENLSNLLFNPDLIKSLLSLSQYWNEASLLAIHKNLRETIRALSGNANVRLAIDALTIKLKRLTERGEPV